MKKNLKITSNLKLNLGVTKSWNFSNLEFLQQHKNHLGLKFFQNVQRLFLFSGRTLNFLFRYYYFSFLFRRKKKEFWLKKNKLNIRFFFFFKRIIKNPDINFFFDGKLPPSMRKKFFLSTLLNLFSSANCVFFYTQLFKSFCYIDLIINLCFFSKRLLVKMSFFKERLKRLFFYFLKKRRGTVPLDLIGRPMDVGVVANSILSIQKRTKFLKKKVLQFFFISRFKYVLEKKFFFFFNLPVYFNIRIMPFYSFPQLFSFLHLKAYKKKRLKRFSNFYHIKTLHKIQTDLISSVISAFFSGNAQLLAEQFAIGINRTRKQKQFVYWFISLLRYYIVFGTLVQSLRLVFFGKLGGKMRTQYAKYNIGRYTVKNQTYAYKVNYGYSSAETYSGTFGVHIWIYQQDHICLIKLYERSRFRRPEDFFEVW